MVPCKPLPEMKCSHICESIGQKKKKFTYYSIELFIKKSHIITVILSGHKSLKTGLFHLLKFKVKVFTVSPISDRFNVCPYCKLEDQLD